MNYRTLQIGDDLRAHISYNSRSIPLVVCIDNFDDFLRNEWSCHWHNEFEFTTVLQGTVEYEVYDGQVQHPVKKAVHQGEGFFVNTSILHSVKGLEPGTVLAGFVFPITFFDKVFFENAHHQNTDTIIKSGITSLHLNPDNKNDVLLLDSIKEMCAITEQEVGYELHCIEMLCKVWRLLTVRVMPNLQANRPALNQLHEQRLRDMLSFVHTHYSDRISIDDIAHSAKISRSECFRCFRAVLKKSPTEYLTEYRLSMAATMLAGTNRTLTDISTACGFNSPSYFGKLFREQSGVSPLKYRTQSRKA